MVDFVVDPLAHMQIDTVMGIRGTGEGLWRVGLVRLKPTALPRRFQAATLVEVT